jgi:acetolactate synthase small subunit
MSEQMGEVFYSIIKNNPMGEQTLGEKRVRITFNPNQDPIVEQIKKQSAALIDLVSTLKTDGTSGETIRLVSLAQTSIEEAAMWAVKAATATK